MKNYRFLKGLKMFLLLIAATFVLGYILMHLWNWVMPAVLGLHVITFWQALGLFVLSRILFGGFHRHGGRHRWRGHMRERWAQMSVEEQEKFRAGMRGRRGCWKGTPGPSAPEQAAL